MDHLNTLARIHVLEKWVEYFIDIHKDRDKDMFSKFLRRETVVSKMKNLSRVSQIIPELKIELPECEEGSDESCQ